MGRSSSAWPQDLIDQLSTQGGNFTEARAAIEKAGAAHAKELTEKREKAAAAHQEQVLIHTPMHDSGHGRKWQR